jgi:hypothetical protein
MKAVPNKSGSYSSYKQVDPKVGDDLFDAACAGVWALSAQVQSMPVHFRPDTDQRTITGGGNGR